MQLEPASFLRRAAWLVELGGALLGGIVLASLGAWLGRTLGQGSPGGWGDLVGAVLGALVGYVVGAPLGVVGSARWLRRRGVTWQAFAGSGLGGLAIALLAEPLQINRAPALLQAVFGITVAAGALIGFHWPLGPRRPPTDPPGA